MRTIKPKYIHPKGLSIKTNTKLLVRAIKASWRTSTLSLSPILFGLRESSLPIDIPRSVSSPFGPKWTSPHIWRVLTRRIHSIVTIIGLTTDGSVMAASSWCRRTSSIVMSIWVVGL